MRTGIIHTYVNGRNISNRKSATILNGCKVSYRVITDNDLWSQVWFDKKEDAEIYIKFYVENNIKKSIIIFHNFFIISTSLSVFSIELLGIFLAIVITITQIFAIKLSTGLDIFAKINTKIFLGLMFIFIISLYGIVFKILRIDPLRLKKQSSTYWLDIDKIKQSTIFKEY